MRVQIAQFCRPFSLRNITALIRQLSMLSSSEKVGTGLDLQLVVANIVIPYTRQNRSSQISAGTNLNFITLHLTS